MNNTSKSPISLRSAAIISGVGLLLMTVLAPIAYLNTFQKLVNFDDAALTAQNILNSMGTFRTAIVLLFVVVLLDVLVAWAIYIISFSSPPIKNSPPSLPGCGWSMASSLPLPSFNLPLP